MGISTLESASYTSKVEAEEASKEDKDAFMSKIFEKIEELYVDDKLYDSSNRQDPPISENGGNGTGDNTEYWQKTIWTCWPPPGH